MNITGELARIVPPFRADDLFDPGDEVECREVERLFVEQTFRFDETVFEQGSEPTGLWRIVTGTAVLLRCNGNCEPVFGRVVRPGEILGLTESLARIPLHATLRTVSSCVCKRMDHDVLAGLLRRRPRIRRRILVVLAENYSEALKRAADGRYFL